MLLKHCCEFQEGYVNPSQKIPAYFGGEIKWLRASDLNGGFVYDTERKLSKAGYESAGKSATMFPVDSLAISKSGTIGVLGILKAEMCGNRAVINIRVRSDAADPYYVFYTLKNSRGLLLGKTGGSIQKNLYVSALETVPLAHGELSEQREIAAVLSTLDAKIDLNQRINAELEALAKAIYDYWFVQFDFPDAHGRPYKSSGGAMVWNDTLKRDIPAGWHDGVLSDIANITMGQSPAGDSYNEEGCGTVFFQGSTDFGVRSPDVRMYTTSPARMAREGDILVSVRAPVGTLNIADRDCCIGRGLAALNSKDGCDGYLYRVMADFKQVFDRRSSEGTTFGSITKDDLFGLQVLIPENEAVCAFGAMAANWTQLAALRDKENLELTRLRDWLLPLLMNGQVRVA